MTVGGRYRVERLLGRGGLGEVWEAVDATLGRRVAVKFVTGVRQYPEAARRFAREARTLAALRHGSIVTVHDAGTAELDEQPLPYLVMELLDGITWEYAHVESVVETGARVAEVLAHVHEARIVHRDVKPANIMICSDGRAVLMDFGIARDDDSLTRTATVTGRYFGTPAYMAPEQLQGRAATPASDVYALGIVLVEKLTGHRLPVAQLMPQVRSAIGEPLRSLLARMTSAQPEQRPTAAECAERLRASARPTTSRSTPTTRQERRERFVPLAVLLSLYAIVLFLPGYGDAGWSRPVLRFFAIQILEPEEDDAILWNDSAWGVVTTLGACVGVVTVLAMAAALAPHARLPQRLAGYGGVLLTVFCLGWQATSSPPHYDDHSDELHYGLSLFYLTTALAIATYVYRDLRTRRPSPQP
ncbi:serine/threonine-protein kinase [Streptomyces sp. JJ38]|uniref:serine/threonine-protein kinase n=1 Tax=Streptomyces sp. JJ38 TaxID=2738128 RepID=UPI001C598B82|nr:serine/threonine-protein kinase [Streptomyces sp. JJ38]MBW1596535.1 serine/threonine protein kinase [Streptomyces sp. JJ38]